MKLINKDKLLQYLLKQRDAMYRQYDRLNREIDNGSSNLGVKISEQSQISYGIDIISALINMLDECVFDLAELKKNDIIIFNLTDSTHEALTNTFEYLDSCGVSAVAMFKESSRLMELDEKRVMIQYLVGLLSELKGEIEYDK